MTKVAVLDDWQGVAKTSADWAPLQARAEVVFFAKAFDGEDDAARQACRFRHRAVDARAHPAAWLADQSVAEAAHVGDDRRAQCVARYGGLHGARGGGLQYHRRWWQ